MEESAAGGTNLSEERQLKEIRKLLWGVNVVKLDVFHRWSLQGFEFSDVESSALVQKQGGPCAVIAPVQGFILKLLLTEEIGVSNVNLSDLPCEICQKALIQALCCILMKSKSGSHFRIVTLRDVASPQTKDRCSSPIAGTADEGESSTSCEEQASPAEFTDYHNRLTVIRLETKEQLEKYFSDNISKLSGHYGVLLFMYSVLLTKGFENVNNELSDTSEPLIHSTYGYGSQALINLMLTGRAVAYVWDNDQDVGGLKLKGINEQADIGFITLMEQMRYCTVGSFYKNPKSPVWVMGSETHLTVLFSYEMRLVSPETPSETAKRVFKSFDPDGNNFIPSTVLQDVLCLLDLVSEPEYVELMRKKLDPESLGIILLGAFMEEFFSNEKRSMPDTFDLLHYNGIPGSNDGHKVKYCKGTAVLLESDLKAMCISNPMYTCLQTKWPNIEITWHERTPSLN